LATGLRRASTPSCSSLVGTQATLTVYSEVQQFLCRRSLADSHQAGQLGCTALMVALAVWCRAGSRRRVCDGSSPTYCPCWCGALHHNDLHLAPGESSKSVATAEQSVLSSGHQP
jgi:hypothetical protein